MKVECKSCGNTIKDIRKIFCNNICQHDYQWRAWCRKVEENKVFFDRNKKSDARRPKKYLIEKRGHQCEICKRRTWKGKPIPLVFDHINGDPHDWRLTNCRVVCGNCDMQLPTYKAKNTGNGRHYRRERYSNNKSF